MGRLVNFGIIVLVLFASCDKRTETAARMSGLWEIESTTVSFYENNAHVRDSSVEQTGRLSLVTTGGLENKAATNLTYAPCWDVCSWEIPKKKKNQLFFSYYSETPPYIQSTSLTVDKHSSKKLVLVKIQYDGDLNILQKSTWKFVKAKL